MKDVVSRWGVGMAIVVMVVMFWAVGLSAEENDVTTVTNKDGKTMEIHAVNDRNNTDKLVLFDPTFSYYTETKESSYEVVLEKSGLTTYEVKHSGNGDQGILRMASFYQQALHPQKKLRAS